MSLDSSLIGKSSEPQTFQVTGEAVQRFMEATEDPALASGATMVYAPPTFPTTFRTHIPDLTLDTSKMQLIHGEQEYHYTCQLHIGEEVTCVSRIVDVRQRSGRTGAMTFLITETTGTDSQGQPVFTSRSTVIVRTK